MSMLDKLSDKKRQEFVTSMVERIKKAIEENVDITWDSFLEKNFAALRNVVTTKEYKGFTNRFMLSFASAEFVDPRFATFNQFKKAGGMVARGSSSTPIWVPRIVEKKDANGDKEKTLLGFFVKHVFNIRQTNCIENGLFPDKEEHEHERLEKPLSVAWGFFRATGCDYEEQPGRGVASYSPMLDRVQMPPVHEYKSVIGHAHVLLHELIHWTGHKDRKARPGIGGQRTREKYGREELVAELGASFLMLHLEIESEEIADNTANYLRNWLESIKADPEMLVESAIEASAAAQFAIGQAKKGAATKETACAA